MSMRYLIKAAKTGQGVAARVAAVEALSVVAFIAANGDDAVSAEVMMHLEDSRSSGAIQFQHHLQNFIRLCCMPWDIQYKILFWCSVSYP